MTLFRRLFLQFYELNMETDIYNECLLFIVYKGVKGCSYVNVEIR